MPDRVRILFVDDEAPILDGLRRLLRPMRNEWEVFTAQGGEAALELLSRQPVDVVVSDMRMPGIDGAQLLEAVRRQRPSTVRIILSGQSDQEALLRTIGPVHQYLSKPCDLAMLRLAVSRSRALRQAVADPRVADFAAGITSLPTVPALYTEILACLRASEPSIARIGELVAQDLGLTARTLQVVNSALFGLPRIITSPSEAVMVLGIEPIRMMVLAVDLLKQSPEAVNGGIDPEEFWHHSLQVAWLAKAIAETERQSPEQCSLAFTAGLMHDCGRLILAHHQPQRYAPVAARRFTRIDDFIAAESSALGADHGAIGAYLLSLWGLPDVLVEAVLYHHRPSHCLAHGFVPMTAVHMAEGFHRCGVGMAPADGTAEIDTAYLQSLGLGDRLSAWAALHRNMLLRSGHT
jgi:HD-like signal output (HDOD) protein/CheY-like chemotaxis protein